MKLWPFGNNKSSEEDDFVIRKGEETTSTDLSAPQVDEAAASQTDEPRLPDEVREYYASTQKTGQHRAWLLGVGTMLATLVFAAAIFFGGRFVYNQFNDDEPNVADNTTQTVNEQPTTETNNQPEGTNQNPSSDQNNTQNNQDELPGAPEEPTDQSADQEVSPSELQDQSGEDMSDTGSTTPTTGDSGDLPETGPGNVAGLFIVTSLAGYVLHYRSRKSTQA